MREKLYTLEKRHGYTRAIRAEIDIELTREDSDDPSIATCRYAVLEIKSANAKHAYVIYDRLLSRIVDGVYYVPLRDVLDIAAYFNKTPDQPCDHGSPNSAALGLHFPPAR